MYQALYRKYRPRNISDVVGQDVAIRILRNGLNNGKLSHAYLFSGPRGSGKTSVAKIIANVINCVEPKDAIACNSCVFCTQKEEQKMDVIEIDAASNNGVDEIREINNKVKLAPSVGKYKVYIIDEVHMLTIGAFNALLKTLEEPPAHVIFILATTDPQKVPTTILSRCQRIEFNRLNNNAMKQRLFEICEKENIEVDNEVIDKICELSDGGMRDAINTLDQLVLYADGLITSEHLYDMIGIVKETELEQFITYLLDADLEKSLNKIEYFHDEGKSIIKIVEQILCVLKNKILKEDMYEIEKKLEVLKILNEILSEIRRFNNPKMLFDLAIIRIISNLKNLELSNNENLGNKKEFQATVNQKKDIDSKEPLNIKEIKKEEPIVPEKIEPKKIEASSTDSQQIIAREIKTINNVTFDQDKYDSFLNKRINNTLAEFSKQNFINLKKEIYKVEDYIHDEDFKKEAAILIDGEIKAASDEYMIFVYSSESLVEKFNKELIGIEKIINLIYNKYYKLVSVNEDKWNEIKELYNSKKIQYNYQSENKSTEENMKEIFGEEKEEIENLFEGLIEYN